MKAYSFYDPATGLFTGGRYSTDIVSGDRLAAALAANTPKGTRSVEGDHDMLSSCIDVVTGKVVDYQPPAPSGDHVWNPATKRWVLSTSAQQKVTARTAALARIAQLEAAQPRALRELALGYENAKARVEAIDAEITSLRKELQ